MNAVLTEGGSDAGTDGEERNRIEGGVLCPLGSDLLSYHEVEPPFAQGLLGPWSGKSTPAIR